MSVFVSQEQPSPRYSRVGCPVRMCSNDLCAEGVHWVKLFTLTKEDDKTAILSVNQADIVQSKESISTLVLLRLYCFDITSRGKVEKS